MVSLMKNGVLKAELFNFLNTLAERHQVSDVEWAKAATQIQGSVFHATRISEYRRLAKRNDEKVGRAFTPQKFILLLDALKRTLGEELVQREMQMLIEQEKDTEAKCHLTLTTLDKAQMEQVWLYLKALAGMKG